MRKTVQAFALVLSLSASSFAGIMQCPAPAPPPPAPANVVQESEGGEMPFSTTSEETATQAIIILLDSVLSLL